MDFLCRWTNSMGSSMVIMWPDSVALRWSTIPARVVDLPDPVAPTTSTSPRFDMVISFSMSGNPSSARDDTSALTRRITIPAEPRWRNTLTRKRLTPGRDMAIFNSKFSPYSRSWDSLITDFTRVSSSGGVKM